MCINVELCKKCDVEIDKVFRDGSSDEEKSLAYDGESGECQCSEMFEFRDDICDECRNKQ